MSIRLRIAVAALVTVSSFALPGVAAARHGRHRRGHSQVTVAGTVASFTGGVLTVKRADGSSVSARVTRQTDIECDTSQPMATKADHGSSGGRDNEATDPAENEATEPAENEAAEPTENEAGEQADSHRCGTAALTTGATVSRARIRDDGAGPFFKQIKLA